MPTKPHTAKRIPIIPLLISLAGALPLWVLVFSHGSWFIQYQLEVLVYTALVASFLGGINWAIAMQKPKQKWLYLWSIIPVIISFVVLVFSFLPNSINIITAWLTLMIVFLATWSSDTILVRLNYLPKWYANLRHIASGLVIIAIACIMMRIYLL